jgi:predicted TIM-barrel fold metal-dependent hydrolase
MTFAKTTATFVFLFVWTGQIVAAQVIDSHVHLFSPQNFGKDAVTAADILPMLNKAKVDRAVVLSAAYWFSEKEKAQAENDFLASEVAKHSDRLVGFCSVHLLQDWATAELERCARVLKLRGLKLHPQFDKVDFRNPDHISRVETLIEKAGQFGFPVLLDSNGWDIKEEFRFIELALKHPGTNIILAHAFLQRFRDLAIPIMFYEANREAPRNLYVDLSAISVLYEDSPEKETLLWYLRKLGMNHVLFGSDFPVFTSEKSLQAIQAYRIDRSDMDAILGGNASRLLNLTATPVSH